MELSCRSCNSCLIVVVVDVVLAVIVIVVVMGLSCRAPNGQPLQANQLKLPIRGPPGLHRTTSLDF